MASEMHRSHSRTANLNLRVIGALQSEHEAVTGTQVSTLEQRASQEQTCDELRQALLQMTRLENRALRLMGFGSMAIGVLLLYFLR